MTGPRLSRTKRFLGAGALAGALAATATTADAATETVVYSFQNNGKDGFSPLANLIEANGTLYGTTYSGGTGRCENGCGTIFSVNTATGAETILHSFSDVEQAVLDPGSLVLVGDTLLGSTNRGGRRDAGTLYTFDLESSTFKIQYYFCNLDNCSDGEYANSGLLDEKGMLFGTTEGGGSGQQDCDDGCGTVFSFDTRTRTETVLHAFDAGAGDGEVPLGGLINVGNRLYGTTNEGGASYDGTVFSIKTKTGAESVVYSFCGQQNCIDGARPSGNLLYLNDFLYGTTAEGGSKSYGTVFSIDPSTHAETVLHSFEGSASGDGAYPSGLVYSNGLLYGTTSSGGANCAGGCGTVYSIDPTSGAEMVIYSFCNLPDCTDGVAPQSALLNVNGTLYGVTAYGGSGTCTTENEMAGCGTVFAITP